jgi:hypothetical protein
MIVADESTFIKNHTSARSQIMYNISRFIPRRVILTGSPTPNGIENLYGQIFFLDRGTRLGESLTEFRREYMYEDSRARKWRPRKGSRKRILDKIKDIVMVVEDTENVGLPAIVPNILKVEFDSKAERVYKEIENDFYSILDDHNDLEVLSEQAQTQKLRQVCSGFVYIKNADETTNRVVKIHNEKLKALKELKESLDGHNLLVGIQFKEDAQLIKKYFGYDVPTINSDTTDKQSDQYIREWKAGNIPMLLAHPRSMAWGLNMQSGGFNVAWFSITWDLEEWEQFIARLRRRGQVSATVFIHILVVAGSMDEVIYKAITQKDATQEGVLSYLKEAMK